MAERRVVVCDICHREEAEHYDIRLNEHRRWMIDLCAEHSKDLLELADKGRSMDLPDDQVTDPEVLRNFRPKVQLD